MEAPEIVRVRWNAADWIEDFFDCDMYVSPTDNISPEQITYVLTQQSGGLFRLTGWVEQPPIPDVTLRMNVAGDNQFSVQNLTPPTFESTYAVAAEPAPEKSVHGDLLFNLIRLQKVS